MALLNLHKKLLIVSLTIFIILLIVITGGMELDMGKLGPPKTEKRRQLTI